MASAVSIAVKRLEIPTYVVGPDSPYPPLMTRWEHGFYPYSTQVDIRTEKRSVQHRAVILENEYVKAIVLPDLGGRLYSLYDKVAGQETFMVPPSVKYQNISMRGAWIAGGIEWNYGHRGHTVSTVMPVSWATRTEPDGTASVWVGAVVRPIESRWAVRISLTPGRRRHGRPHPHDVPADPAGHDVLVEQFGRRSDDGQQVLLLRQLRGRLAAALLAGPGRRRTSPGIATGRSARTCS